MERTSSLRREAILFVCAVAVAVVACGGGDPQSTNHGGGSGARSVTGTVTYDFVKAIYDPAAQAGTLDLAHPVARPVRNGTVAVMQGDQVLASTSTDDHGHYSVSYTPAAVGSLSIVAAAKTTTPSIEVRDNTDQQALWTISAPLDASTTTKDVRATLGWTGTTYDPNARAAAPFAILDTMLTASRAVLSQRPNTNLPPLVVNWSPNNVPEAGDKSAGQIGSTHYSQQEKQIFVLGKVGVDTDEFDDHVIAHEWGHFFEANLSRSDSPAGQHSPGDLLDPRIAFGEGYGNAMSGIVLNDPIYADTLWGGPGGALGASGFDLENEPVPTDDPNAGPFSEMSIARILYDLADPANESWDRVALGVGRIVDVLVGPERTTDALTTIASFISGLKQQAGVNAPDVDALLAHYNIGPITTEWGDGDPLMADMYQTVVAVGGAFPYLLSLGRYNTWGQNEYFVFMGNGAQVTISASSAHDVGITLYRQGEVLARADQYGPGGTEQISGPTQAGQTYVLALTGFDTEGTGEYPVTLNFTSP